MFFEPRVYPQKVDTLNEIFHTLCTDTPITVLAGLRQKSRPHECVCASCMWVDSWRDCTHVRSGAFQESRGDDMECA